MKNRCITPGAPPALQQFFKRTPMTLPKDAEKMNICIFMNRHTLLSREIWSLKAKSRTVSRVTRPGTTDPGHCMGWTKAWYEHL
jgi:hypothetical protein